jgi:hypothetical protein
VNGELDMTRKYEVELVAFPNLKLLLTINNVNLVLFEFYNVGVCWSSVNGPEKLLQGSNLALGFAFDL